MVYQIIGRIQGTPLELQSVTQQSIDASQYDAAAEHDATEYDTAEEQYASGTTQQSTTHRSATQHSIGVQTYHRATDLAEHCRIRARRCIEHGEAAHRRTRT
jgi:hypothetical protein